MAWCLVKHRDNFTFVFYRTEIEIDKIKKTDFHVKKTELIMRYRFIGVFHILAHEFEIIM